MDELILGLLNGKKIFVGDLTGRVGKYGVLKEFMDAGDMDYGVRNEQRSKRCYPRLCDSIWFDINEYLVQKDKITLNYL